MGIISDLIAVTSQLRDALNGRTNLQVTPSFTSLPELGNNIQIHNMSTKPVLIEHWEIFWRKTSPILRRESLKVEALPDEGHPVTLHVPPYGTVVLSFTEGDYFGVGPKHAHKGRLYLRLHLVGKGGSIDLLVYDPSRDT